MRAAVLGLATAVLAGGGSVVVAPQTPDARALTAYVRVDSVGFLPGDVKRAYLMTSGVPGDERYAVVRSDGTTVATGSVGATSRGRWSRRFPDVYPIAVAGLRTAGSYRIVVSGTASAQSPPFLVESARALGGGIVRDGISFFQTQRDGPDQVAGPLHRRASHLRDRHAAVYRRPRFASPSSDTILGSRLHRVADHATADVEGGWFDAGDYLKFTHTAAWADVLLYESERALGSAAPASLRREAWFGQRWLRRMWHRRSRTLLLQVGIGSGNRSGDFLGDHDLWRLPQHDDGASSRRTRYATSHRPVFRAAPPGHRISPNLAGRVAAAFALGAQVDAGRHPKRARSAYRDATSMLMMADTASPPHQLLTALPHSYYPETSWRDDMALGATEVALAAERLHRGAGRSLREAAHWARASLRSRPDDTLNLYEDSPLAYLDLIRALRGRPRHGRLAATVGSLERGVRRSLAVGTRHSRVDPFRGGSIASDYDVDSHTFGLMATAELYSRVTGDHSYDTFASEQRDWLFGANPWGASFMVGEGANFPRCMQHQVANLAGSLTGKGAVDVGAVVNGPNGVGAVGRLGSLQSGVRQCPSGADPYRRFTGHGSRYADDVRAFPTSEPALDMTGMAVFAGALSER